MSPTYTAMQLDALKELGNIGSGNAATSLSTILNTFVDLEVTEVEFLTVPQCHERHGIHSNDVCSVIHGVQGELEGLLWFVTTRSDIRFIADVVASGLADVDDNMVLHEITNILGGTYLASLGNMLAMRIDLSPPEAMPIEQYLSEHYPHQLDANNILFIKNMLVVKDRPVQCYIHLVLKDDSLAKLLQKFGL